MLEIAIVVVTCISIASFLAARSLENRYQHVNPPQNNNDVFIIVTAHPDDESMFFVPTIRYLQQKPGSHVGVLCLSNGNFDGLGAVREKELVASCVSGLGMEKDMVRVINHPKLQDGPVYKWPAQLVSDVALEQINDMLSQNGIQNTSLNNSKGEGAARVHILTFDSKGVSGHPNHIDVHYGMCELKNKIGNSADFHQLVSVPLWYKYLGPLPSLALVLQTYYKQSDCSTLPQLLSSTEVSLSYFAMLLHQSQFVWYRRAFVVFSWYTYFNSWEELS